MQASFAIPPPQPMDTATSSDMSQMFPSFPPDSTLPAPNDFALAVNQVMQGLDPVSAAHPSTSGASASSGPSSSSGAGAGASSAAAMGAAPSCSGLLDAAALAVGPASRKRGLAYARHVKAVAREEFKEKRRRELEAIGEGDRTKRRKKNDTSMTERQKYRRRLQKNQDSAAAARHAQDAYLANLELQAESYDGDMTRMSNEVRKANLERDELARLNAVFMDHTRSLEAELQRLREKLASQTKKSTALDELAAAWSGDAPVGSSNAPAVPPTPPSFKALFEDYSAPTYNFPDPVSGSYKITPAL